MLLIYIIFSFIIIVYVFYISIYINDSSDYINTKFITQTKYQAYLTKRYYESNIGFAFYDNVHLGVINVLYL